MPTSLIIKLQLKPGQYLRLVHVPKGYFTFLNEQLKQLRISTKPISKTDAILFFVNNLTEAKEINLNSMDSNGIIWIAYPKLTSKVQTDINRDTLRALLKPSGWRPVRLIALDETWSIMRIRPEEKVKKRK